MLDKPETIWLKTLKSQSRPELPESAMDWTFCKDLSTWLIAKIFASKRIQSQTLSWDIKPIPDFHQLLYFLDLATQSQSILMILESLVSKTIQWITSLQLALTLGDWNIWNLLQFTQSIMQSVHKKFAQNCLKHSL